jgi:hypothetical protein
MKVQVVCRRPTADRATADGLHCDPPSGALQSIFALFGRRSLADYHLILCNPAVQSIRYSMVSAAGSQAGA